ncbi:hypothetical protein EVAR_3317_1 [Eumeta japonica]|uniref:Uncharacterized protein n=1 Tax=Eumeta variegata TaxID=151549 RepID=A0A4C1SXU9_EUMVA|nr:hypothetical protein EVAR_3317_1 [Eumeta japonica]
MLKSRERESEKVRGEQCMCAWAVRGCTNLQDQTNAQSAGEIRGEAYLLFVALCLPVRLYLHEGYHGGTMDLVRRRLTPKTRPKIEEQIRPAGREGQRRVACGILTQVAGKRPPQR